MLSPIGGAPSPSFQAGATSQRKPARGDGPAVGQRGAHGDDETHAASGARDGKEQTHGKPGKPGASPRSSGADESAEQRLEIAALAKRDSQVRAHEAAHQAAGGSLVGAASFTFVTGADGRRYAVGGEVSVDASPVSGDPQATIQKMDRVRAAALAPADPSGTDLAVAADAAAIAAQARSALSAERSTAASDDREAAAAAIARRHGSNAYGESDAQPGDDAGAAPGFDATA